MISLFSMFQHRFPLLRACLFSASCVLSATLSTTAQAEPIKCPPLSGNSVLSAVTVYDGPIEENASLVPDSDKKVGKRFTSVWQVAEIYDAGRQVHVLCKYGATANLPIKIGHKVQQCVFRSNLANAPGEMVCK